MKTVKVEVTAKTNTKDRLEQDGVLVRNDSEAFQPYLGKHKKNGRIVLFTAENTFLCIESNTTRRNGEPSRFVVGRMYETNEANYEEVSGKVELEF